MGRIWGLFNKNNIRHFLHLPIKNSFCCVSSDRKPGQLQVLLAGGLRDGVTHRRAPPAGGALRQALPHARIRRPLSGHSLQKRKKKQLWFHPGLSIEDSSRMISVFCLRLNNVSMVTTAASTWTVSVKHSELTN